MTGVSIPSDPRAAPDALLLEIADYAANYEVRSERTIAAARLCLMDALACALDALDFPECTKLIGPAAAGTIVPQGARVPGTNYVLDPETAAFSLGCLIRWLDCNDTYTGAQGSHPSDTLAGILPLADYLSRRRLVSGQLALTMRDVLAHLIRAYEIQGCLGMANALEDIGAIDQNLLCRVAGSAVLTRMLGGSREHIVNAVSNAFMDTSLLVYRRAPNTGSRKNWACADAIFQAMRIARMAMAGEPGYPSVLSVRRYGFQDARFQGKRLTFPRALEEHVIRHTNFKFVPAGMHAQTAAEAAIALHPLVKDRLQEIDRIEIRGHRALITAMHKTGLLNGPADRDHCVEYIVSVALIFGKLAAHYYENDFAADARIDPLRARIHLTEDPRYTEGYYDTARLSNAASIEIRFDDGSCTPRIEIEYPAGHWKRRAEVMPVLTDRFQASLARRFDRDRQQRILDLCSDETKLCRTPVHEFMDLWAGEFPESSRE